MTTKTAAEKTIRRNGKWAKITRTDSTYTWALGWDGEIKAAHVHSATSKVLAEISVEGWLDD